MTGWGNDEKPGICECSEKKAAVPISGRLPLPFRLSQRLNLRPCRLRAGRRSRTDSSAWTDRRAWPSPPLSARNFRVKLTGLRFPFLFWCLSGLKAMVEDNRHVEYRSCPLALPSGGSPKGRVEKRVAAACRDGSVALRKRESLRRVARSSVYLWRFL